MDKLTITFLTDQDVLDADKRVVQAFDAGKSYELIRPSAERWLRRKVALFPEDYAVYMAEQRELGDIERRDREHAEQQFSKTLEGLNKLVDELQDEVADLRAENAALKEASAIRLTPRDESLPEPESKGGDDDDIERVFMSMVALDSDRDNPEWWTTDGRPEVRELKRRGLAMSAAKRDASWSEFLAG